MLDDCGIETSTSTRATSTSGGRDRCSMTVGSRLGRSPSFVAPGLTRSRSMLDDCGIETTWTSPRAAIGQRRVAIDARWLWDRDNAPTTSSSASRRLVAIDARWLWDRDTRSDRRNCDLQNAGRDRCSMAVGSRQAAVRGNGRVGRDRCSMAVGSRRRVRLHRSSRSMLDGCGIETPALLSSARTPFVAIDAR